MKLRIIGVAALTLVVGLDTPAAAQGPAVEGRSALHGRVIDGSTGGAIALAQVSLEGTSVSAQTDLNGRYSIQNVPVGVYRMVVRVIGYTPKTVTNVQVAVGEPTQMNVTLDRQVLQLSGIEVTAELERGSSVALLEDRKAAPVVTNAIGSEEMSRSPDSDASESLKRVTGMSVVGDRYVVVRGLGDRYSSAQLNGVQLPSTEPDRKAVPFDLFPTNLLETIVTSKTYSPDQPGDYSGGLVDIQTKDFPGSRSLQFSIGAGFNSATSFRTGLGYPGGDLDFLGVDDGTRGLPASIPANQKVLDVTVGDGRIEEIGESFSAVWQPRARTVPFNQNFSLSLADETRVLGADVGFLAAATYANSYTHSELVERVIVVADQEEAPETDYSGERTERTVRWSLFGKTDILLSATNQLAVRSLFTRTGEDDARVLSGFNRDRNNDLRNYSLRYVSRSLWTNTVEGDHYFESLGGTRLNWRIGLSRATSDEPDRREVVYDEINEGQYAWRELTNSGTRYFTELGDRDVTGAADISIPLGIGGRQIKVGGLFLEKDRDFFNRRFRFRANGSLGNAQFLDPDELFVPANIGPGQLELAEDTRRTDNYRGVQSTRAGYVMLDLPIGPVRLVGGGRVEQVRQTVNPYDLFPLGLPPVDSAVIDNTDFLPGVNLTVSMGDRMNLRAAFSRTVARPEFREQAAFDFIDFAGGFLQVGNPGLRRSAIFNYDLRWELFPRAGDLVAVSGFYKSFTDPIEALVLPSSELIATWDNARSAEVLGTEIEMRAGLGRLAPALEHFTLSGNVTLVHSAVQTSDSLVLPGGGTIALVNRERALQGQSPYLINAALNYANPFSGTTVTALYNRFGRRIDKVGTQVLPDVFEEPQDQLDLVVQQRLSSTMKMRLSGSNLLDASSEFRQSGTVVRAATRGRSVAFSISIGSGG